MENILNSYSLPYNDSSNIYNFDNSILLNWYPKRIIKLTKKFDSILELGLGHGYSTNIFSQHFMNHLVLDGSSAVIENFRQKHPNCQAKIKETLFENFEDNAQRFQVIVLGFILEHVDDPLLIINKYKKLLAPSGQMFIAVPNAEALNRRLGYLAGVLPNMQTLSQNDIMLGHKRYYTVQSLTEEVNKANCQIERIEGIYLKPFTTTQIMSLNLEPKFIESLCIVGIDYPELCCGILMELKF